VLRRRDGRRGHRAVPGDPEFLRDPDAFGRGLRPRALRRREHAERPAPPHRGEADRHRHHRRDARGRPGDDLRPRHRRQPQHKVAFTGYQVEGTPGRELLETGSAELDGRHRRVAAQVESHDFSAHADRDGLLAFLDEYRGSELLVNHGDRCADFAEELRADGFAASAPELGERVTV